MFSRSSPFRRATLALGLGTALVGGVVIGSAEAASTVSFNMVRSNLPAGCAANVKGSVKIESLGFAERMTVTVSGLPSGIPMNIFVTQVPNPPFGISWYVAALRTGSGGTVTKTFISRFNTGAFAVAPGIAPAPKVHPADATTNPAFGPVHTFHLGIWFGSPSAAKKAGASCPATVTPFNGAHTAGVQVLSTRNFADAQGPLRQVD